MCGAFTNDLLTANPRKRCEQPARRSPESCPEPSENAASPGSETDSLLKKVVLIWQSLVVLFAPETNQVCRLFFFFSYLKLFLVFLEVFIKLLENKFSCAFSSQNAHKNTSLPKTREKLLRLVCEPLTPDIVCLVFFFRRAFHPIKSYFLFKVLMIKCPRALFDGKFQSISYHLLHCKRFSPYEG